MKLVEFRAAAEADLTEAYGWYEHQRFGLGVEFREAVRSAIAKIRENPNQFQIAHRDVRRALLKRFPYGLFYRELPEVLIIVACFHTHRNPARLLRRSGRCQVLQSYIPSVGEKLDCKT